jgi:hypothetical protein
MASTNTDETTARTHIALRLADCLSGLSYTAEDVEGFEAEARQVVARLAGVSNPMLGVRGRYVPSDQTWAATMTILRDRETKPDPFAGFPQPGA